MKPKDTYAVVTGAGKGLGKSLSVELARRNKNLVLLAKEGEDLFGFGAFLTKKYGVKIHCVEVDFLQEESLATVADKLKNLNVNILVNNAGIGGSMFFDQTDIQRIDSILQVNIRMLVMLTRLLISKLKNQTSSYILNVASMASCCPIAYKSVYPASKAFVYSFSKSLAEELKCFGVHVCVLLPGPIKTNSEVSHRIEKQGWWVKAGLQTPTQLAQIGIDALFRHKSVVIPGLITKINWLLLKILPKSICIPMVSQAVKNEISAVDSAVPLKELKFT
ncbi:SDR family NAD(P)-dependent oxidoreductase [Plebeiibacterium sediminum]|uniref:SDR family NAD(P)-dependent oxidoreductase n=1 Tax=Plebeiibacterium sediminum TaxID=2992112 RepID=A0AAE3SET1_9BACT|nr:SDR family NAD(P)-dependent oxidoreductase [Plebeiobacterium sediminum]MCW3786720.1 SDR family NAD(P)-dependent oxidoreductase [Plebeiobacterium sediminum]